MTTPTFEGSTLPRSREWHILEVVRSSSREWDWSALLIDVDPDDFQNGRCDTVYQSCWLKLGRHKSRDDAWTVAEQMMATRH
jgi:hypothetical protein